MIVIEPLPSPGKARRLPLNRRDLHQFLALAIKAVPVRGRVSVLLTGDDSIRDLNRQFRQKNQSTDVLSFPAPDHEPGSRIRIAGDLAISLETAARQAESFGHALAIELKILMLHGLLHLAGFDHEKDSGEMARREQELRDELNLPLGLIERASLQPSPAHPRPASTRQRSRPR